MDRSSVLFVATSMIRSLLLILAMATMLLTIAAAPALAPVPPLLRSHFRGGTPYAAVLAGARIYAPWQAAATQVRTELAIAPVREQHSTQHTAHSTQHTAHSA